MTEPAREPDTLPTDPAAVQDAAPAHSTPPSHRFRCPHCHNPIQLADGHSDEVLCPACGHSFRIGDARATISATPMRPLGKFQLLERIGAGGFGAVWKAQDTTLDRTVALKIPHSGILTTSADLGRFQREARASAQLRHPGIVPVHEVVMLEGLPTIVSDFVTGVPLKDLMETRRLGIRDTATLVAAAADAVHYAHSMGVVHRDLKPANIMVPYAPDPAAPSRQVAQLDRPLLMDFGLALRTDAEVTLTQDGHVLGTPAYMSPEQAAGRSHQADARSDVWALGVVLYELLTGELPFRGSKVMMLMQVMNDEPKSPRRLDRAIPRDVETVCLKCLQKEPSKRYASAADLAADLRRFLNGEPVLARRIGRVERVWRWCRRYPAVASLLAAVAVLLVAGTTISMYFAIQADRRADEAERSAQQARTKEAEARAREKEAQEAQEQAQIALARSWIGPLGLWANTPLVDAEVTALWQVVEDRDERQRYRFIQEALRTPATTAQLKNQVRPALHAAIGLNAERRAAIGRLLMERLQDTALSEEHRLDVAYVAVALDKPAAATTTAVADVLLQALSKSTDAATSVQLAQNLSALAESQGPKDGAALLIRAMRTTNDAQTLNQLGFGLVGIAKRLDSDHAGRVAAEAANILAQPLSKTTDATEIGFLTGALSSLAPLLDAKSTADVAAVVVRTLSENAEPNTLNPLQTTLAVLAARLDAAGAAVTARHLAQSMSKLSDGVRLSWLAMGLTAVSVRLEPGDADTVAAILLRAMKKAPNDYVLSQLANGVAGVAARLSAPEAAQISGEAVAILIEAIKQTPDSSTMSWLTNSLSGLTARMERKSASDKAAAVMQVFHNTSDAYQLTLLGASVSALASRLEPEEAARLNVEVATRLMEALSKTTDSGTLNQITTSVRSSVAELKAKDAAALVTGIEQGLNKITDPYALNQMAACVSAVAERLEPMDSARVSSQVIAVLNKAIRRTSDPTALTNLTAAWSLQVTRLRAEDCATAALFLAQTMSRTSDSTSMNALGPLVVTAAARLKASDAAQVADMLLPGLSRTADVNSLVQIANGLSALAARLGSKEAADLRAKLAAAFIGALQKAPRGYDLYLLANAVPGIAADLAPGDAAAIAELLARATSRTTDPTNAGALTVALSAIAERLGRKEASATAVILLQSLNKATDANTLAQWTTALSVIAQRLEPDEAARTRAEAAHILAEAASKYKDSNSAYSVAITMSFLATWLQPEDRANVADVLTWTSGTVQTQQADGLMLGLSSVLSEVEPPELSQRAAAVAGVVGAFSGTGQPLGSLALLRPAAKPLACRLPTQHLVDLLKMPTCLGDTRRLVLDYLGTRYGRSFDDHWDFVEYAKEHLPEVDLTTPPKRPRR